jgi:hypothetical protein
MKLQLSDQHLMLKSHRADNLTGAQAPCADIYMLRDAVHKNLDALDVGPEGSV